SFLRSELPDARISWVVERRASEILVDSPVIDELIVIDSRRWRKHPLNSRTLKEYKDSRRRLAIGFDGAVDFQGLLQSAVVAAFSVAPRRIGFESCDLRACASAFWPHG